ncbi:uncharacterized protein LOC135165290 isoform X1 [Diachasmimorpha longicaudata]|uniref:uncharacterized protein LOC135165290 isoform X1 n=1 Tax=Diachasmimorpha longicaudata TaxID=58733 RepID=UPI0030B877D6
MIDGVSFLEAPEAPRKSLQKRIEINTEEGTAILFGNPTNGTSLSSNPSKPSLYCLEDVPLDIRCRVYLQILSRIFHSENSLIYHEEFSTYLYEQYCSTRNQLLQDVVDTITSLQDPDLLLEGLSLLAKDRMSPPRNRYRDKLVEESLIRVNTGEFHLERIISLVKIISNYHDRKYREAIDLLWSGIEDKQHEITSKNFIPLIKILDYFGESQRIIKIICEKKLEEFWKELNGSDVAEVLKVFQDPLSSDVILECVEKWSRGGLISQAGEEDVINFVKALISTGIHSKQFEMAIQEFIEKQLNPSPALISSVMTYCHNLRIRNPAILENCANYVMKKGLESPESLLASIVVPFGYLNYDVSGKFWQSLQKILEKKLGRMTPNDVVNILLSCAHLQKFSLQFSSTIFKSRFMRRVKSREKLKQKMRMLDKSLALEFHDYVPHFQEERQENTVALRPKLRRVLDLIYPQLVKIYGEEKISKSVVIGEFLNDHDYILDAVVHETPVTSPIFSVDEGGKIAVVIHLPEDYCRGTEVLIGPRVMKTRHLRKMGMRVVTLDYGEILRWSGTEEGLAGYLKDRFDNAEEPF